MNKIIFATGNAGKMREIKKRKKMPVDIIHAVLPVFSLLYSERVIC